MSRHRASVTGEYSLNGYTVLHNGEDGTRAVYSAGNHPKDSQARTPDGVGLRRMRGFCIRTCREITAECRARYGGVTRVPEEETA